MVEPNQLTAIQAATRIRNGELTSEALVRACLARIEEREAAVAAWEYLNPAQAVAQARACDRMSERGALHGVPVGFKDICDTADMPTTYGSRAHLGHRPTIDATCVALTRTAGGVVLGKTVSTEFAGRHAGKTANPHDPLRTPGGSSSGSAAAVADYMVPLATATQTGGSVIRPAAYCGAFGYKATFGHLSFEGIRHGAETFDTLGCMARSVEDLALFRAVLMGVRPEPLQAPGAAPRIAFCRTFRWEEADDATRRCLEAAAQRLRRAGAAVSDLALPKPFADIYDLAWTIMHFEYARNVSPEWREQPDNVSSAMRKMIDASAEIPLARYLAALERIDRLRAEIQEIASGYDAFLTPSAIGEAHVGLNDTGPVTFNVIWNAMGMPCITIPAFKGPNGMPIGAQFVAARHRDGALFDVAGWAAARLM
ncbi:MAG: amidase [Alphaproteobacteria bacterium]|nr:amidase [Alphaproteobacteria bacterium]